MAVRQFYRGNPAEKQYVLSQNFVGGLNTRAADDVVTDIEFRELLNADLGDQGVIRNRKGFKDLVVFNSMMETVVDEKGDATSFPEGIFRFAKVVNDPQRIISRLTEYETLQEFREALQPIAYEVSFLFLINISYYRLKISKRVNQLVEKSELVKQYELNFIGEDEVIQEFVEDNDTFFGAGTSNLYLEVGEVPQDFNVTSIILKTIEYQVVTAQPLTGELSLGFLELTNTDNPNNVLIYYDGELENTNFSFIPVPGFEDINIDITRSFYRDGDINDTFLGDTSISRNITYNNSSLVFKFIIEYTYTKPTGTIENVALGEFKSKIPLNNLDFLDSVYTLPGDGELYAYNVVDDKVERVEPYRPNPFEVKFIGFNVLADNPLTFIADQGISIKSIEGIFLTRDDNKPMRVIDGGRFELNVIHTGIGFTTDELGIEFFINFDTEDEQRVQPILVSARDVGGLFIFEYNAVGLSAFSGQDLTIRLFELDKSEGSDLTDDVDFLDGTPVDPPVFPVQYETIIKVEDTSVFEINKDYVIAQPGAYERVRIKEIVDTETLLIFGRVNRTYVVSEGARIYNEKEKTENITFDPFIDIYPVVSGLAELLKPIERLDIKGFRIIEIGSRLVYYGRKEIWFSDINEFGYIPNFNFITLPLTATDEIQRIVFFRGFYVIFTKDEIYRIVGLFGSPDFRVETVNKFVGCIAPNSVRNVGNELFFLSRDGLYKLKSSVFQDNLENVEKIDKAISDQVQISEFVDSLLYDEQYILYYNEGEEYDTLRMFYDIELGRNRNPFVRDIFTLKPELLVRDSGRIFALNNGRWFIYGEGFTDFMPDGEEDSTPYTYPCKMETPSLALGFPTHQKKFKNIFIKALHGEKVIPLFMTVKVDNYDVLLPSDVFAFVNELGEVEYSISADPNIILETSAFLGDLELGVTALGELTQKVHKLSFSGKGKNIKLIIEQQTDASFGIVSIGYLYKLGKVKE
jgi:hypothetical protein